MSRGADLLLQQVFLPPRITYRSNSLGGKGLPGSVHELFLINQLGVILVYHRCALGDSSAWAAEPVV
jgi:hypothetical protein